MRFSLVIPTRNRLDLLKFAVTSVLGQEYADWEVVISDNASSEDIEGYVNSLNEPRIKYSRSEKYLSITQSWNRCIDRCTGDYVIMIGDDDILLKNYFQIAHNLIERFEKPDLIYTNAFLYAYPNVIPNFPKGVFQSFGSLQGMPKHDHPFWLDEPCKRSLMQATLKFSAIYSTNMQHALISRSLLEKTKREGKFFHSPYPDIYAMSALLHEADRVLIYPKEIVVIGISIKSHGYFSINGKDQDAVNFLNPGNDMNEISSLHSVLLPGSIVFTFWLGAIELFKRYFPLEKYKLILDYGVYRKLQSDHVLNLFLANKTENKDRFNDLVARLSFSEKSAMAAILRGSKEFQEPYNELLRHLSFSEKLTLIVPVVARKLAMLSVRILRKILPKFLKKVCRKLIEWGKKSVNRVESIPQSSQDSYTPLNPPPAHPLADADPNRFSTILEIFDEVEAVDCSR